jgi:hypothetical protein
VIEFDAEPLDAFGQALHRKRIVILAPVRVDDIVAKGPPPRLPAINARGNTRGLLMVDDEAVFTPKVTIQKPRVIVDTMPRREQTGIDMVIGHPLTDIVLTTSHLYIRKRRVLLIAIVPSDQTISIIRHCDFPFISSPNIAVARMGIFPFIIFADLGKLMKSKQQIPQFNGQPSKFVLLSRALIKSTCDKLTALRRLMLAAAQGTDYMVRTRAKPTAMSNKIPKRYRKT